MKNIKILLSVIGTALLIASCSVTVPVTASDAPIGSKRGISKNVVVLGISTNSDYSVAQAAKNGGLTGGIATVDEKTSYVIPIVVTKEIIVTGE